MGKECFYTYRTSIGPVTLASNGDALTNLTFGRLAYRGSNQPDALTNEAANQVQEYLAGKRRMFDLPIALKGTAFQELVWSELGRIPYGFTETYGSIAEHIGKPGAARAVGGANNANPLPILIPCHRVVPASGGIGGYRGGQKLKAFLLQLEQRYK